eukprot:scaffold569_cov220-Alexandrium_tamarense.AAC.8
MSSTNSNGDDTTSPTKWSDIFTSPSNVGYNLNLLFPPLTSTSHKGSHGRIAILGGSTKYSGAPYYAAQSALLCGVDLATVFCAYEASVPIKCYSPELMVQSVYSEGELDGLLGEEQGLLEELQTCKKQNRNGGASEESIHSIDEEEVMQTMEKLELSTEKQQSQLLLQKKNQMDSLVGRLETIKELEEKLQLLKQRQQTTIKRTVDTITSSFPTLHALCVGPGMGRHPLLFTAISQILQKAMESQLTLVLDADALFMLSLEEYRDLYKELRGYERCVMTPNLKEWSRLCGSHDDEGETTTERNDNIIVQKGYADVITYKSITLECNEEGGLKRSGGIGDVLAGTISAFMAWDTVLTRDDASVDSAQQQRLFAVWVACCVVKKATELAYKEKRRAMSAIDVLNGIGGVVGDMENELTTLYRNDQK